ncbi:MAG TPA: aminotransferase class V-fold PLP-dependent enzyme [Bryobacteraceae bacterium]|nr:aminotransferase class V-fold PLP-dependent enzyme [Bryobacteraceae bacterium]
MRLNRRKFVTAAAGAASGFSGLRGAAPGTSEIGGARADFPWAEREVYLNTATEHPLSIHSARAMEKYIGYLTDGPDAGRGSFENARLQEEVREMFARLIHAKPSEIGFVPSTQIGENVVLNGMGVQESGGNVVTNDLHYPGSLFNYQMRRKAGLDVRVVKHRDWQIEMRDLERVVDRKTKLIALALVSNVNGYLENIKAISELAHAHGAYVFADVIQAAGAVPIDVRAMGIDFLACSAYKWLMGGRFGYLYAREDLQGTVLKPPMFGGKGMEQRGASRYEVSTASHLGFVCQHEALQYIHRLGVENIQAHARPLTERLRKELPAIGYPCITPKGNESPIVTFLLKDAPKAQARLERAKVIVTVRREKQGGQMRVSPSVFNNLVDAGRLVDALA